MNGRAVIGVLLVVFGGLLLIDQLDLFEIGNVVGTFWPLLLIGLGLWGVATTSWRNLGSMVLLVLGVVFLGQELDLLPADVWSLLWPVGLLIAGVWLLISRGGAPAGTGASSDRLASVAIMSGRNERVTSTAFKGGDITAIMGGVEVHLADAMPVEDGARLTVTAIMGGVDLYVPADWDVDVHATPIFGGVDDNRPRTGVAWPGARPKLEVRATVLMGGLDINEDTTSRPVT